MKKPRILEPNRSQMRLVASDLDSMVPADHQVRAVWEYVSRLDLSAFLSEVGSVEGHPGRPATDPRILLSLWIQATLDGVGSARELERLAKEHVAYQWICGGVNVNYHSLSDFRADSSALLESILVEGLTTLLASGLVDMVRVAHDGMKVRASAGASSFRSRDTIKKLRKVARGQLKALRDELEGDQSASRTRQQAARERSVRERTERIDQAMKLMKGAEARKRTENGKKKTKARVSTTDPTARVMKMPDGGYRPAYNLHAVTDTKTQVIVGIDVTEEGTDTSMAVPLAKTIEKRLGKVPQQWLYDGGCNSHKNLKALTEIGCEVYAPIRPPRNKEQDRTKVRKGDPPAVAKWRERMSTPDAKQIYKERAATAECVNASIRNRGLRQFLVRGLGAVKAVALLHAVAHNFQRMIALGAT